MNEGGIKEYNIIVWFNENSVKEMPKLKAFVKMKLYMVLK